MGKQARSSARVRAVDKQERQTNLVLVLLNTAAPLPLSRIRKDVPGYGGGPDAVRQRFERDKRELRTAGIEIRNFALDTDDQVGYRIEPSSFWLPDLGLDEEEARALGLAAATLGFGRDGVSRVLLDAPAPVPTGALPALPALPYLFRAIAERCEVSFTHKARERHVVPGTLTRHGDRWYLGTIDLDKEEPRHFRVDRITGIPKVGPPGSGTLSDEDLASMRAARPWETRDESRWVTVRFDPSIAPIVVAELGPDAVVSRQDDGSVDLRVGWGLPGLARSWLLSYAQHAEVRSPRGVRDELVDWLAEIRDAQPTSPGPVAWRPAPNAFTPAPAPSAAQRLLAVLTTLAQQRKVSLSALAARFGLSRDEMRDVLLEAACMGVPPFLHGDLLDIRVPLEDEEGDEVIWEDSGLYRPQLTWRDGFELAASARAALTLTGADGDGALSRALAKLEAVTGARVTVDTATPPALVAVESAVVARRQLLITYYSASSDSLQDRRIDPVAVRERGGRFYVLAWCHLADAWRTFRVDRIEQTTDVGERAHEGAPPVFEDVFGFADAERVDVALRASAAWLAETDGVELVGDLADGRVVARIRVASANYLSRLLLQAGTNAEVLAPASLTGLAAEAATRVLARYGR